LITTAVSASASTLVMIVCGYLVFAEHYYDGLIGRIGLAIIALAAFVWTALALSEELVTSRLGAMMWVGIAFFFTQHLCNFLAYLRRKKDYFAEQERRDPLQRLIK